MFESEIRPRSEYEVLATKVIVPILPARLTPMQIAHIKQLVREAIKAMGSDHKQYHLWQIAAELGMEVSDTDTMEGTLP